jgi:hypothetical protein
MPCQIVIAPKLTVAMITVTASTIRHLITVRQKATIPHPRRDRGRGKE